MRMSGSAATSDAVRLASCSVCAERPAQAKRRESAKRSDLRYNALPWQCTFWCVTRTPWVDPRLIPLDIDGVRRVFFAFFFAFGES